MLNKADGVTDLDVWNNIGGIDIQKLGLAHAIYYTFNNFK